MYASEAMALQEADRNSRTGERLGSHVAVSAAANLLILLVWFIMPSFNVCIQAKFIACRKKEGTLERSAIQLEDC